MLAYFLHAFVLMILFYIVVKIKNISLIRFKHVMNNTLITVFIAYSPSMFNKALSFISCRNEGDIDYLSALITNKCKT